MWNVGQFKKGMKKHSEFFEMIKKDKDLLLFFSFDKIEVWCDGLRLWSLSPNTRDVSYKKYYDTFKETKTSKEESLMHRTERRNQQKIAYRLLQQNNLSAYPVCVEFTIPSQFTQRGNKPEVDFLVLDAENKTLYMVEYKCSYKTSVGSTSIKKHFGDFNDILKNKELRESISQAAIEMYDFYTDFYHAKKVEKLAVEKVVPAFLFTDFSIQKTRGENNVIKTMLKGIAAEDKPVVVWNFKKAQDVDFSKEPFAIEDFIKRNYPESNEAEVNRGLQNNSKKVEFTPMAIKPSANITRPEDIFQIKQ